MKNVMIILFVLLFCLPASADQRGVSFEKDGVVYVISSEMIARRYDRVRDKWDIVNMGEVYVSGVTVTDSFVTIPPIVYCSSAYCRKDTTVVAEYRVLGIGEKAFAGARLKGLAIPRGLRFIGNEAFRDLEITDGVLVVPLVKKMKANIFDGMKSKVLLLGGFDYPVAEKTFDNKDALPDFYVLHEDRNLIVPELDKRMLYTIGVNIYTRWLENSWRTVITQVDNYKKSYKTSSLEEFSFLTILGSRERSPKITCRYKSYRRFEKDGTDIDMMPPCEFVCKNPYTNKKDTYDEFVMNETLFRCGKGKNYSYFTLDGKPIVNTEGLLDGSGRDPFGLQVRSKEEVKKKNEAKEREHNLNKKVDDLKKAFGF